MLAGGAAFGSDGRFAYQLGADGWAPDARGAAELLSAGVRAVRAASTRKLVDELPHLADQEYAFVSRSTAQLVRGTIAQLVDRFPPMRTYNEVQRRHTADEVAQIVDHLAAALYVDDDDLFAEFITWTADVLDARGLASASLYPALELLSEQLKDFATSQRLLQTAYWALNARGPRDRGRCAEPSENRHGGEVNS